MPRYIDADKLKAVIENTYLDGDSACSHLVNNDEDTLIGKFQTIDIIDDQPTVDVQEVRHGKLKQCRVVGWEAIKYVRCSICGVYYFLGKEHDFDSIKELLKYCPNCGAKMGGEK